MTYDSVPEHCIVLPQETFSTGFFSLKRKGKEELKI
jgi:hypothetical protein